MSCTCGGGGLGGLGAGDLVRPGFRWCMGGGGLGGAFLELGLGGGTGDALEFSEDEAGLGGRSGSGGRFFPLSSSSTIVDKSSLFSLSNTDVALVTVTVVFCAGFGPLVGEEPLSLDRLLLMRLSMSLGGLENIFVLDMEFLTGIRLLLSWRKG